MLEASNVEEYVVSSVRTRRLDEEGTQGELSQGYVLRNTFMLYGSLLSFVWLLFCWLRIRFPQPYTIRRWTTKEKLKTSLAENQYGYFSWIWQLNTLTDDEIMDHCGLDALCFLRSLLMGYKLCLLGIFNSIWLMPLYKTAESSPDTESITDPVVQLTVSNLPAGSSRFAGTVVASYMLFGYTMYLILKEFPWYIERRKKLLRKPIPRNYAVYVSNIPIEYRSNARLEPFFQQCFVSDCVVEARIRVSTANLAAVIKRRKKCLFNLETALAMEELRGEPPKHRAGLIGEKVDSIDAYAEELRELNHEITGRIEAIERITMGKVGRASTAADQPTEEGTSDDGAPLHQPGRSNAQHNENQPEQGKILSGVADSLKLMATGAVQLANSAVTMATGADPSEKVKDTFKTIAAGANKLAGTAVSGGRKLATTAVSFVIGGNDGEYFSGGFICFNSLAVTNAARQLVHHPVPFVMEVKQAPDPSDIIWPNVGRSYKELQAGMIISMAGTISACLFWTIPMTGISTLSSVKRLKEQFDFVNDAIQAFPAIEPILQQLAPFLVILLNSTLPYLLTFLTMFEGPIAGAVADAWTFPKLSAFMIIQTFFVSAISSGVLDEVKAIVNNPLSAVDLLANTLPAQSTYFIQIAFVGTFINITWESLRVVPLSTAFLRRFFGPRLTEKQRQEAVYGWMRPLADPYDFEHASNMAQITVLFFMIILVYQPIAPLTSYVLGFCFAIVRPAFLHQFVYIYPASSDSGGIIWANFIKVLLGCMLIAEFTIVGFLALKKAEVTPLMIPLIVATALFNGYIREEHFRVAEVLSSKDCMRYDVLNGEHFNLDFVRGAYLQEELREKKAYVEDIPESFDFDRGEYLEIIEPVVEVTEVLEEPEEDHEPLQDGWGLFYKTLFRPGGPSNDLTAHVGPRP